MSLKNKLLIKRMSEEFSKGNRKFILTHLADDIKWKIVGMPEIKGKEDFINVLEMLGSALGGFSEISVNNMISDGEYVVVENSGKLLNPSYCEVYKLKDGKVLELRTYVVDTELNQ